MQYVAFGVMAGIETGISAGGAALFTTLGPVVGGAAGATHLLVTFIVAGVFIKVMGKEAVQRNIFAVFGASGAIGAVLTTGIIAGVLTALSIPFTLAALGILLVSFLVSTLVLTACLCVCTKLGPRGAGQAAAGQA